MRTLHAFVPADEPTRVVTRAISVVRTDISSAATAIAAGLEVETASAIPILVSVPARDASTLAPSLVQEARRGPESPFLVVRSYEQPLVDPQFKHL